MIIFTTPDDWKIEDLALRLCDMLYGRSMAPTISGRPVIPVNYAGDAAQVDRQNNTKLHRIYGEWRLSFHYGLPDGAPEAIRLMLAWQLRADVLGYYNH